MAHLSKSRRFAILARDGFRCRYCGRGAPDVPLHVDHVVPRSAGGNDTDANLVAACFDCNAGKSDSVLVARGAGYKLDQRHQTKRHRSLASDEKPTRHLVHCDDLDDEADRADGMTCAGVYCSLHARHEYHWIADDLVGTDAVLERWTAPGAPY